MSLLTLVQQADCMLPLLAEESLPPDTSWEFSFAVGHTDWPHRIKPQSTRTGERHSIPRNAGRFCNTDRTCTSLLEEVMTCSRKNSPSWCRNSPVQFSQNKPRIPVGKTPPPAQSLLNSLPPSFCKDAAIRSQLCSCSSSLPSPLSLGVHDNHCTKQSQPEIPHLSLTQRLSSYILQRDNLQRLCFTVCW